MQSPAYAELYCLSNFSFLRGASHAQELVRRAYQLGYAGLAITDECSMAGVARAHVAAREYPLPLIIGSHFIIDGHTLVFLACNHDGYTRLCQLITKARRRSEKGRYQMGWEDIASGLNDCLVIWLPPDLQQNAKGGRGAGVDQPVSKGAWLADLFSSRLWIGVGLHRGPDDEGKLRRLYRLGEQTGLPLTACGGVIMHRRSRRALADVLTATELNTSVQQAGYALLSNGEKYLRSRSTLAALYPFELLQASVEIAQRCRFSLNELRYQYPDEVVPAGKSAYQHLRELTRSGAENRWPEAVPEQVRKQIEHELKLIEELDYAAYFLTIHDIVRYARRQNILCQGRGSAANSVVCYCLGITVADPGRVGLLFERFISKERNEPPDIDVDFEHERREEVMQYIYRKYGRGRAALAATVSSYRRKSAIRDVGKALGLEPAQLQQLSNQVAWWDQPEALRQQLSEVGFDPDSRVMRQFIWLVAQLLGFPRHLSQHVGGFVISRQPLETLVPVENASMADRTVIQWDKDDLESLGLMKVDCLALGMLTALHRCFDLIQSYYRHTVDLYSIKEGDKATYKMIQQADTIGVFQIESRAQQAMLPRLKPENYYDLVIEIAIVRPGPIQGNMVHPYLQRRSGKEPVEYPSEALKAVLDRTLGVPIFQEQAMKIAMVAAGFTAGEADQLRRAMAAWKRKGGLEPFQKKLINGMLERGYELEFAERIFEQIKGFGDYGFPESHSASFAILAYASAWLKCHYPAAFTCALLNSQPMGFYSPSQLIQDAQRHGVKVFPVDVRYSRCECTLEPVSADSREAAIRLGLQQVKSLSGSGAEAIVIAREQGPFGEVQDLVDRSRINARDRRALAQSGALRGLAGHRHRAHWQTLASRPQTALLQGSQGKSQPVRLPPPSMAENLWADYGSTGISLRHHPMSLLRSAIHKAARRRPVSARQLTGLQHGQAVYAAGLVTNRQRPGTASGVIFLTLEDETGLINVVVWPKVVERQRRILLHASLLGVAGHLETEGSVFHLIAHHMADHSGLIQGLRTRSRDFH